MEMIYHQDTWLLVLQLTELFFHEPIENFNLDILNYIRQISFKCALTGPKKCYLNIIPGRRTWRIPMMCWLVQVKNFALLVWDTEEYLMEGTMYQLWQHKQKAMYLLCKFGVFWQKRSQRTKYLTLYLQRFLSQPETAAAIFALSVSLKKISSFLNNWNGGFCQKAWPQIKDHFSFTWRIGSWSIG